jgi:integrase
MSKRRMPGEGSIYQRTTKLADGRIRVRWHAQWSVGGRTDRRLVTRTRRTRPEAAAALRELQAAVTIPSTRISVGDYLERWVRDARNIRPTTRHGYEAVITYHLRPTIGHVQLRELSPVHVENALAKMAPTMSPKSLRNVHGVLRRALGQALRAGLVARNVASREYVDAPRVPVAEPRALSAEEVRRFLGTCRGDRIEALFVTAVGTGARLGELGGLANEDVDLTAGRLVIRRALVRRDGTYLREEPKTERSKRTIPLTPTVVLALIAHRDRLIAEGFIPTATGPVFVNRDGGPLSGSWVTHHFYGLLEAAGIARLPFKNLRTTFASRLHEAGVPDQVIADLLGHTRTYTTKKHYIASTPQAAEQAIERLVAYDQSRSQSRILEAGVTER